MNEHLESPQFWHRTLPAASQTLAYMSYKSAGSSIQKSDRIPIQVYHIDQCTVNPRRWKAPSHHLFGIP